jgi:hypothetical protein
LDLITSSITRDGNRRKSSVPLFVQLFVLVGAQLTYRWDEWVPEARLLKLNEAGISKRKQLADQQTQKSRSAGTVASPIVKEKGKGRKGGAAEAKKRARDSGIE